MIYNERIDFHQLSGLKNYLHSYAYSLTANNEDAEDLVQDTFLKALTNKDKFDPGSNLRAWIFTIMKNTFINKYRRDRKQKTVLDSSREPIYLDNSSQSDIAKPDSQFDHKEIVKIIDNLKEEQRIPFQMHFQGYKYKEIADSLNVSIGTIKSRIYFCRKKLMIRLNEFKN